MRRTALITIPVMLSGILLASGCATPSGKAGVKAPAFPLRINCAATVSFTDSAGQAWQADRYYEEGGWGYVGGDSVGRGQIPIDDTKDAEIYRVERWGLDAYRITVPKGEYQVRLHFAETYDGITAAGDRVYSVSIEGKSVLADFDPYKESGETRGKALVKPFDVTVTDGVLDITFERKVQEPMINGIEVIAKSTSAL